MSLKLRNSIVLLAAVFLTTACTSLHKKADKEFQAGEYDAAAADYSKILAKDSGDGLAQQRLKESRQHILENRLIEIRQLRMSENYQQALDRLDETVMQENAWQISPTGVAFSTQTEEVELLFRWYTQEIVGNLNDGKYLKAKIFDDKYKGIFMAGDYQRKELALTNQIINRGVKHCEQLKGVAQGAYAKEFVNRYCIYWGRTESDTQRAAYSPARGYEQGFSRVKLIGTIQGVPDDALASLSDTLLEGLKKTPFYDPAGRELSVNIQGQFTNDYKEHPTMSVFIYDVQVPYQVMVTVPYVESEPYTAYRSTFNAQTGQSTQEAYTDYRSVTRYRQESETRYQTEQRQVVYPSTDFDLHYLLTAKAAFTIDQVPHVVPMEEQLDMHDSFHDAENASIGLHAKSKQTPTDLSWLQEKFAGSGNTLTTQVTSAWDAKYCQIPGNLQGHTQIDSVMKCLKGSNQTHDFVENWFKSKFGLPYKVVGQTIGFGV